MTAELDTKDNSCNLYKNECTYKDPGGKKDDNWIFFRNPSA